MEEMEEMEEKEPKKISVQLREIFQGLEKFSYQQIFQVLGIQDSPKRDAIRRRFHEFLKRGEIKRIGYGTYQYTGKNSLRGKPLQERMWRAIRILKRFSAQEIARNAGASINYAQRYLKRLREEGYVEYIGKRKMETGRKENVFQVKKLAQEPPVHIFNIKDPYKPIRDNAWRFIRPIVEESIIRNPEIRKQIISLGRKIIIQIQEIDNANSNISTKNSKNQKDQDN
jgi:AraC-like DNA-binding protein